MANTAWSKARAFCTALIQTSAAFHLLNKYVEITACTGPSMYPTFNTDGDFLVVEALTSSYEKGDIVISSSPLNPSEMICKRIKATEGEEIKVLAWHGDKERHIKIPKGHVWLEGDNDRNSTDSRYYGAVPLSLLRGKVFFKLWPPNEVGSVSKTFAPGSECRQKLLDEIFGKR